MKVTNVIEGKVKFGDVPKQLVFFDVEDDSKEECFDRMHHVHILDRSGSMYYHIDDLIEDVKRTLDYVDPEDFITVLWFASAGDYRTVLKGVKAKEKDSIKKILDTLKSVRGCTCFSDPLKELSQIVDETAPMCSIFNVTLFTDGEPVTPWSEYEEIIKIFDNLEKVKNKIVAFNAVGYGNYYNKDLLLKMVKTSEYGVLSHAREITEYCPIFQHNKAIVENIAGKKIKIETKHAQNVDVVGLTTKTVKYGRISQNLSDSLGDRPQKEFSIRLAKNKNRYMLVFAENADARVYINGEPISIQNEYPEDANGIISENAKSFYAYAYKLFEEGKKFESTKVLGYIGDETLFNRQINTFTNIEIGELLEDYKKIVFDESKHRILEAPSNSVIPDKNAYCVLELLKDLVELKAVYRPVKDYKRISRKKVDEFNLFEAADCGDLTELTDLVVNQDRMNLSIRFRLPGEVKLNPKRAKQVGLPDRVPACIFRNHAIVKDGALNIEEIEVVATCEIRNLLYDKMPMASWYEFADNGVQFFKINLKTIPVINCRYLDFARADEVFEIESLMLNMEAQNKYLNTVITEEDRFDSKGETDYTPEQIAVLIEHGMKTPGVYSSINPIQQEAEDYIYIRECRSMIKGFSSLPTFAKVHEKQQASKKLTAGEALLAQYEKAFSNSKKESLIELKKSNQAKLKELRFKLAGIKMSSVLNGSKILGLNKEEDGSYTYTKGDRTLVVKYERKQVAI